MGISKHIERKRERREKKEKKSKKELVEIYHSKKAR
jgi:hypothetical protein